MPNQLSNTERLRLFYQLFYNEKRFEPGAQLLAENFVNHHPGAEGVGRAQMVASFSAAVASAPQFHIQIGRLIAQGDQVWTHSLITGLPGDARVISVDIWRFNEAGIAEHWDVGQRVAPGQNIESLFGTVE